MRSEIWQKKLIPIKPESTCRKNRFPRQEHYSVFSTGEIGTAVFSFAKGMSL
jgi:hypothetical protein